MRIFGEENDEIWKSLYWIGIVIGVVVFWIYWLKDMPFKFLF